MPTDINPYGGVFGGWLMSQMALAAGSLASRHSCGKAVIVAADALTFPGAPNVGDEISLNWSSREFTFVALGANNQPRPSTPH